MSTTAVDSLGTIRCVKYSFLFILSTIFTSIGWTQGPSLIIPVGITNGLQDVALSPDDQFVLLTQRQNKAILYEKETGKQIKTIVHLAEITDAKFNSSGNRVATSSKKGDVMVTDIQSGDVLFQMRISDYPISHLLWVSGNHKIIAADVNNTIFLLNAENGNMEIKQYVGESFQYLQTVGDHLIINQVNASEIRRISDLTLDFSLPNPLLRMTLDGKNLFLAKDNILYKKELYTQQIIDTLILPSNVRSMNISANGEALIIFTDDQRICRLNTYSGAKSDFKIQQDSEVLWCECNENASIIAFRCKGDDFITVLDFIRGRILFRIDGSSKSLNNLRFDACGQFCLAGGLHADAAYLYSLQNGEIGQTYEGEIPHVNSMELSPDNQQLLLASEDGSAKLIDVHTGETSNYFGGNGEPLIAAKFNPNGEQVILCTKNTTQVYSTLDFSHLYSFEHGSDLSIQVVGAEQFYPESCFSDDGVYLIRNLGNKLVYHNASNGSYAFEITNPNKRSFIDYRLNRNASQSMTWNGKELLLFESKKREPIDFFICSKLSSFKLSSDGHLYSFSDESGLHVFEWKTNAQPAFMSELKGLDNLDFSKDNKHIALISGDRLIIYDREKRIFPMEITLKFKVNEVNDFNMYFTPDSRYVVLSNGKNFVYLIDIRTGNSVFELEGLENTIDHFLFSSDYSQLFMVDFEHKLCVWNTLEKQVSYQRIEMEKNNWLAWDRDGRFDGTASVRNNLYFTCGTEIIDLNQMKEALYVPGLVGQINEGTFINYTKLEELDICGSLPLVKMVTQDERISSYSIEPRSLGLHRVDVYVDKKRVMSFSPEKMIQENGQYTLNLERSRLDPFLIPGQRNAVKVVGIAKVGAGEMASRGVITETTKEGEDGTDVRLYAVMIGVSDYKDDALDLKFPVKDARSLGSAIELSSKPLLGEQNVHMYYLTSDQVPGERWFKPEKERIRLVLQEIGQKARAQDVVLLFFAGHGMMTGQGDKLFTFLTEESSNSSIIGVQTTELENWLSSSGPNTLLANKTILIFDACNSGAVLEDMISAISRSDDEARKTRQVEDLKDKSGMFILAASAGNQLAYEVPKFKQGLLTYSMLKTLRNNTGILEDGNFINLQKWFLESELELDRTANQLGFNQDAQPFGTANIRIGVLTEEVKNTIQITEMKPSVLCVFAENPNGEDPLNMVSNMNAALREFESMPDTKFVFTDHLQAESVSLKLNYTTKKGKTSGKLIMLKNGLKINEQEWTVASEDTKSLVSEIVLLVNKTL